MDLYSVTDEQLDEMRLEPKHKVGMRRERLKGKHIERGFDLVATWAEHRRYRVFVRHLANLPTVFSVGLVLVDDGPGRGDLVLCRYNSGHHPHRNIIERDKVPATPHIHIATARYIRAGHDPDGFAFPCAEYTTCEGALRRLSIDCAIGGILSDDDIAHPDLFQ